MIQAIITYLIISLAFARCTYKLLCFFNIIKKETKTSSNCAGCSSDCEIKKLKFHKQQHQQPNNPYKIFL